MIIGINFTKAITVPVRKNAISYYNAKDDGAQIQAEETPLGFTLHIGETVDGRFRPNGKTVRVPWHMIEYVTEQKEAGKEQKK